LNTSFSRGNAEVTYSSSNTFPPKVVPLFREILRISLPTQFPRFLIYCTVPKSIIMIESKCLNTMHFIVLKGLNYICLCNLTSNLFKNAHISFPLELQKVSISSENDSNGTIFITINSLNETLSLLDISKIGFLKNRIFHFSKNTLRDFPLTIRQLYLDANIVDLIFSRYGSQENTERKYPMNVPSCVKNCSSHGTLTKISKCHYNGSSIFFTHRDWYDNCYANGECHERHMNSIM